MLAPAAAPAPAVAAGGCERAAAELERHDPVGRLDADRPAPAAGRDVAARVDEAGPGRREELGGALGGVALADAAEVEADAGVELDAVAVDADAAAGSSGGAGTRRPSAATSSNERS